MNNLKYLSIILIMSTLFNSCSGLIESTRQSISGDTERKQKPKNDFVGRGQYDELMEKYKMALKENEQLRENGIKSGQGPTMVDNLANATAVSETVDVFAKNGPVEQSIDSTQDYLAGQSKESVNSDIDYYYQAMALDSKGKTDEALKIFQHLEKSKNIQIAVRALHAIGLIYMQKQQFDLALQVFEKILHEDAFSGVVLSALKGAVVCCDKLGLEEKKIQYTSVMKDVFGLKS